MSNVSKMGERRRLELQAELMDQTLQMEIEKRERELELQNTRREMERDLEELKKNNKWKEGKSKCIRGSKNCNQNRILLH